jgi:transcriptional regulator with XRE-family HTH domain
LRAAQVFGTLCPVPTLLTQTRKSRGLSLDVVAAKVGTDPTNLSRVEKGLQLPKRELARALHKFYGGVVPIGLIYDANGDSQDCPYCGEETHARKARGA